MFAGQCTAKNGTYNCHRAEHENTSLIHEHHFASNGEHRVARWDKPFGEMKFRVIKS